MRYKKAMMVLAVSALCSAQVMTGVLPVSAAQVEEITDISGSENDAGTAGTVNDTTAGDSSGASGSSVNSEEDSGEETSAEADSSETGAEGSSVSSETAEDAGSTDAEAADTASTEDMDAASVSEYFAGTKSSPVTGGEWIRDGLYYRLPDKSLATGWVDDGDGLYYMNSDGKLRTGWLYENGIWYYFYTETDEKNNASHDKGRMASNVWIRYKGSRYLIGSDGAMRTGWQLVGGKWYYAGGDGAMKTGWQYLGWSGGRNWFYFDANGAMLTGWQKLGWSGGSNWFYFDSNGKMLTGWQQLKWSGGTDYFYFDAKNGAMAANTTVDGYKVDANGVRGGKSTSGTGKTSTTTTNKGWVLKSGRWYYYQNGKAVTGWQYLGWGGGSSWFFFDSNGKMVTGWQQLGWSGKTSWYYFDTKNGNMVTGWQYLSRNGSRSWFYFNRSGAMLTGWQYLGWSGGTNWFYFDSNGKMLTGWQQLKWSGGTDYFYFDAKNGAMAVNTVVDGYKVDANGVRSGKTTSGESKTTTTSGGWKQQNGKLYYYDANGKLQTGWLDYKGSRYYLSKVSDGHMLTQWGTIDGKKYYFGTDGIMKTGWQKISGSWYFFGSDGAMRTGWQYLGWSGGTNWFYFDSNGKMLTGWQQLKWSGGKDYFYFNSGSGAMAVNTTVDGYTVDANGVRGGSEVDMASVIANTKTAQKTNQIIVVAGHNLTLWKKSGNDWVKSMDTYCGYGKGGFISAESHSENTTRSPIGSYPILFAFGTSSNPGTSMTYRNVTSKSYWSAERSTYNTWVESSTKIRGEHLADYYQYKYAMAVGFNTNPTVYGKGSAIFVHCKSTNSWDTGGCISLSESDMVELLKETGNGAYIIMVPDMASVANW